MNDSLTPRESAMLAPRKAGWALIALLIAVAGALSAPQPARSQAVVCVNCSTVFTQVAEYAEALAQTLKQIEEYRLQVQQYQDQLKNVEQLGRFHTDDALSGLRQVESLMNQGRNIRYTLQNLNSDFARMYPDVYETYSSLQGFDGTSWDQLDVFYEQEREVYDNARTALLAAQQHSRGLDADQQRLNQVEAQLADSDGRLKALQAAGQYAQINAAQMMKLRQVALLQTQMVAAQQANEARERTRIRAQQQVWVEDDPAQPRRTPNSSESYRRQ
jgi:P-type conjugative transfer protein TrbJ